MMNQLYQDFLTLNAKQKKRVHVNAGVFALKVWRQYCQNFVELSYCDSVVGMVHLVDIDLPKRALQAVRLGWVDSSVAADYREPIVALQDMDFELPEHVAFAYYAIYNLYRKYCQQNTLDDWLIVNQSISAEPDASQWQGLWAAFLSGA